MGLCKPMRFQAALAIISVGEYGTASFAQPKPSRSTCKPYSPNKSQRHKHEQRQLLYREIFLERVPRVRHRLRSTIIGTRQRVRLEQVGAMREQAGLENANQAKQC